MNNYSRYIASKTCLFSNIFRLCLRTQFIHKLQKCDKNVFFSFEKVIKLKCVLLYDCDFESVCKHSFVKYDMSGKSVNYLLILILFFSQLISLKYKRRLSVFIISMENLNLFEFGNSIRPMDLLWCMYYFLPKDIPVKRIRFNMIDCWFFLEIRVLLNTVTPLFN